MYGVLINEQSQVLITDEIYDGKRLTKFPGGRELLIALKENVKKNLEMK